MNKELTQTMKETNSHMDTIETKRAAHYKLCKHTKANIDELVAWCNDGKPLALSSRRGSDDLWDLGMVWEHFEMRTTSNVGSFLDKYKEVQRLRKLEAAVDNLMAGRYKNT